MSLLQDSVFSGRYLKSPVNKLLTSQTLAAPQYASDSQALLKLISVLSTQGNSFSAILKM